MDIELKNLQFLGIYEILQETNKLMHKWRRLFTKITIACILPLSLLFFTNMEISNSLIEKITQERLVLQHTQKSTPKFLKLFDVVSSKRIRYVLFNFASLIFSSIFSLLSTSAVIYTVAYLYTTRNVSFKHVTRAVPKAWKRLFVTFMSVFTAFSAFHIVAFCVLFSILSIVNVLNYEPNTFSFDNINVRIILFFFIIVYCSMIWYLTIIWQLSSAVLVLEESCGFKAMAKSKALLKGKMTMVTKLLMLLSLPFGAVQLLYHCLIFQLQSTRVVRGILGIIWVLSFLLFFLFKLVAETVVYFVCKSYHQEGVDKLALLEYLQGYLPSNDSINLVFLLNLTLIYIGLDLL